MSDNDDNPEAQNENELAGLDAKEAAQQIHDDIRFRLEPANEYKWGDPESEAFAELLDRARGSRLAASIPATTSDEPYLTVEIHLLRECSDPAADGWPNGRVRDICRRRARRPHELRADTRKVVHRGATRW